MAKKRTTIKLKWNIQPLEEDVEPQSPPSPPSPAPAVKTQQQPQNAEFANRYSGFHPPSADWKLPRIRADTPDPQEFYEKYIATRTPCVLTHGSATPWAKGVFANWSSLAYLKEKAGNENIMVEEAGAPGLFGTSRPRIPTTFGAFLDALPTSPQVYLTTQYAAEPDKDDEGMRVTDVYPPPLSPLLSDISPVPPLLARLVPQQHNLWIGSTPIGTPSSSGLHHDHADNLYVLVSGHKTFTLFSPRDTALMDVHGSVREVHPNGYIAYEHGLRGDGAFALDAAEWRVDQARAALVVAEDRLDQATGSDSDGDEDDAAGGGGGDGWDAVERCEAALDVALAELKALGGKDDAGLGLVDADDTDDDADHDVGGSNDRRANANVGGKDTAARTEPPSFSRIPVATLHPDRAAAAHTPDPVHVANLSSATRVTVDLEPGEMLYLPASWFHEVTSRSVGARGSPHIALNYWMHPPSLESSDGSPYADGFWRAQWVPVEQKVRKMLLRGNGGGAKKRAASAAMKNGGGGKQQQQKKQNKRQRRG